MKCNTTEKQDGYNEITARVSEKCTGCRLCLKECGFLTKYGTPGDIAGLYNSDSPTLNGEAFECSLCSLCTSVCPENIDPASMFLAMRRKSVNDGNGYYSKHSSIVRYEKKGTSQTYSLYLLPENCDTVFFPGCTFTGTRPGQTKKLLDFLQEKIPHAGVVLDCCTKPSHDLGRQDYFQSMFNELIDYLTENGIKTVIVACPNCYKVFNTYGEGLKTVSVYEVMAEKGFAVDGDFDAEFMIHDPCACRFDMPVQQSVRTLAEKNGLTITEPTHSGNTTLCCGEGGSAGCINPSFSSGWTSKRTAEAGERPIISYCAGCVHFLGKKKKAFHILDFLFEPDKTISGRLKVSSAPFTYLNRLRLKKKLRKQKGPGSVGERNGRAVRKVSG